MDEFSWAIGLYEGEGTAVLSFPKNRRTNRQRTAGTHMTVVSTDLDVLERFQKAVGYGTVQPIRVLPTSLGQKPRWTWVLHRQAAIDDLLTQMFPHLSQRRKEQAEPLLAYINRPGRKKQPRSLEEARHIPSV